MTGRLAWRTATLIVLVAPLVTLALQAFSTRWFYPDAWPDTLTTSGVRQIGFDSATLAALRTGLVVSGACTIVSCAVAWPAARVLSRPTFAWRGVALLVLFVPTIVPAVGLAIGLDVALLQLDLAGGRPGVVLAHLVPTLPYTVAVLSAVFVRHDDRSREQAAVLGATPWQAFRMVTLRLVGPGLAVAALFTFLVSWSQYLVTLLVGGGQVITITVLVFSAVAGGNPTSIGVLAVIAALPPVLVLTIAGRTAARELAEPA